MDLCKISNPSQPGDTNYGDLRLPYQDDLIVIKPGEERILSFDVATAFFGHPGERNVGNRKDRTSTYDRIRFKWGYQVGQLDASERWEQTRPPFRVTTMDGDWIPMVLDDPDGLLATPGFESPDMPVENADIAVLRSAIAEATARADKMEAMVASLLAAAQPGVNLPVTGSDTLDVAPAGDDAALPPVKDTPVTADGPRASRLGRG
jgi:hypothetical protein